MISLDFYVLLSWSISAIASRFNKKLVSRKAGNSSAYHVVLRVTQVLETKGRGGKIDPPGGPSENGGNCTSRAAGPQGMERGCL